MGWVAGGPDATSKVQLELEVGSGKLPLLPPLLFFGFVAWLDEWLCRSHLAGGGRGGGGEKGSNVGFFCWLVLPSSPLSCRVPAPVIYWLEIHFRKKRTNGKMPHAGYHLPFFF